MRFFDDKRTQLTMRITVDHRIVVFAVESDRRLEMESKGVGHLRGYSEGDQDQMWVRNYQGG